MRSLFNEKASLSYNDLSAALVNHKVRRKDKESSSSSTTEALTAREIGSNHQKGKRDVGKSKTSITDWERTSMLSAKKKDIERLIIQGSRKRRDKNQRQISHRRMIVLIL